MEFIIEIILYFFFDMIFGIPGAVVRWLWFRPAESFSQITEGDQFFNKLISGIIVAAILVIISLA